MKIDCDLQPQVHQDLDLSQEEDLSVNVDTDNFPRLEQESESSDCVHETKSVEPTMSQHVNEPFSSQTSLLEPHTTISFERNLQILHPLAFQISYKRQQRKLHFNQQPCTMNILFKRLMTLNKSK
jgi:hypothetical protein